LAVSSATSAVPRAAPALVAPAPGSAGDIGGVVVSPTAGSSCAAVPQAGCNVVVHVSLGPHATEPVAWGFVLVDRCTGASLREPGSGVEGLASYQYVYDTTTVTFATAHPTSVYAVTRTPAVAASAPLLVAGAATC
jgi:hypothetical protein